jgi:excinuclease ABC subunit B
MAGRGEGEPPDTLLDYMKLASQGDWLLVVDESHVTLPQLRAMYAGDRARKLRLVKHGYRLPSALDNRPLRDDEFWKQVSQAIFLSATPSKQELEWTERDPVHMTIRPTFVCDPVIHVRPPREQLEDLLREIRERADRDERTLALALTKRDAEDLASYLIEQEVNATYIHSGLTTHERADALKALQRGDIDCLVGVNLLREGLDLPQVSLVAILNADSEVSLFQVRLVSLFKMASYLSRYCDLISILVRASFDRKLHCFKQSGGRHETSTALLCFMLIESLTVCSGASTVRGTDENGSSFTTKSSVLRPVPRRVRP